MPSPFSSNFFPQIFPALYLRKLAHLALMLTNHTKEISAGHAHNNSLHRSDRCNVVATRATFYWQQLSNFAAIWVVGLLNYVGLFITCLDPSVMKFGTDKAFSYCLPWSTASASLWHWYGAHFDTGIVMESMYNYVVRPWALIFGPKVVQYSNEWCSPILTKKQWLSKKVRLPKRCFMKWKYWIGYISMPC